MERRFDHVLITGGAGYVGSLLVPALLDEGYRVTVYDIMYFGDGFLPKENPNLNVIKGDIRDANALRQACGGVDAIINLACISNDASFELNEGLSESINYSAFEPMVLAAKKAGVRRFIYASSSSVYGVSDAPEVTEDHPLVPLTLYNKFKGLCEPLLFKHQSDDFVCVTIRPATLCGYAPRQRLDLTVNILTNFAVNKGEITVFGGKQLRPNLHIKDMVALYSLLLKADDAKIAGETFNVGYQNQSVADIAERVRETVGKVIPGTSGVGIVTTPSDDNRSYHISSKKIERALGFVPHHSIEDAVSDLCDAFEKGLLPNSFDNDHYFNVQRLKAIHAQ